MQCHFAFIIWVCLWCGIAVSGIIFVENWSISIWSRVGVHYRAEKKYKKCLGKSCLKGQLQADSFLVGLIFILPGHISKGDSLMTCELDMLLVSFYI